MTRTKKRVSSCGFIHFLLGAGSAALRDKKWWEKQFAFESLPEIGIDVKAELLLL